MKTRWCHNCSKECEDDGGPEGCVCPDCGCSTNIPLTTPVLLNRIKGLYEENKRLKMSTSPWPPVDVVRKLVEAVDHLLDDHNCDIHGYEEIAQARDEAKKWLKKEIP